MSDKQKWPEHLNLLRETHSLETFGIVKFELIEDERREDFERYPESYQVERYLPVSSIRAKLDSDQVWEAASDADGDMTAEVWQRIINTVIDAAFLDTKDKE